MREGVLTIWICGEEEVVVVVVVVGLVVGGLGSVSMLKGTGEEVEGSPCNWALSSPYSFHSSTCSIS